MAVSIPKGYWIYKPLITRIALEHQLDPTTVLAVVWQESGFNTDGFRFEPDFFNRYLRTKPFYAQQNPRRVSSSYGLLQIMLPVAHERGYDKTLPPEALFVPEIGLKWGCVHLRYLLEKTMKLTADTDLALLSALASYNGGFGGNHPSARLNTLGKCLPNAPFSSRSSERLSPCIYLPRMQGRSSFHPSHLEYLLPIHSCAQCPRCGQQKPLLSPSLPRHTPETFAVTGNTAQLTKVVAGRIRTLADLIRVCEIDEVEWEVTNWTANKWEMAGILRHKEQKDEVVVTEMFQVKASLRRRVEVLSVRSIIAAMKAEAKATLPVLPYAGLTDPYQITANSCLLQLAIPDVHIGKLAWKPESGANYDIRIAERLFETALGKLIERTAHHSFERVLFVVGSDLLHSDNPAGTTTKGTPLDTDGRFAKSFWVTRKMMTRSIERLRLIAPVDVVIVGGNHDFQSTWHLGDSLECWYHDCPDVTINNNPTSRKYYEYGQVMLMLTHGDKGRRPDYPLLMATEQPAMFGRTRHREAHTGHIHQLQVQEQHGVRVRVSPALCAADAWHNEMALTGQARAAESFVWDRTEGLIGQYTWTVPEEA